MTFVSCAAESETADSFGFASVWQAYLACRRRKQGSAHAQSYDMALLDNIHETALALRQRRFSPSRSFCFVARQPKAREIHAAAYRDRVVHHLLVPRLEAFYEPVFIHDLYSNRRGKGTHAAVDRLQGFMRSLTGDGQPAWYLQLDVRNFFNSIDRRRLFGLIKKRMGASNRLVGAASMPRLGANRAEDGAPTTGESSDLLWLTRVLLTGNPAQNAIMQGSPKDFSFVPEYKRLSNSPAEKGLPIGNLTSQFFANVYLNELDQFVKHELKCRHYLRYVDDFVLLHHDPAQLREWRDAIECFLRSRLELSLKERPEPRLVADGADFLGYIVRPHYRLVRRRVVGNLRQKLDAFATVFSQHPGQVEFAPAQRQAVQATLASYLGHFRHANSQRLIKALWQRYPWLADLFAVDKGRVKPLWEPALVTSLRSQWRFFCEQRDGDLVLMQVGRELLAFDQQAQLLAARLGRPLDAYCRPGFTACLSISMRLRASILRRIRKLGLAYCLIVEEGYLRGGMKRRVLHKAFHADNSAISWRSGLQAAITSTKNQSRLGRRSHA